MTSLLRLLPALCLLCPVLTFSQTNFYYPPLTGDTWETIDPLSLDFCPERIDSLYQYLKDHNTKSFLLLQDGRIVLEKYFGTFTRDSFWYWASAGKSLTAFLTGQAQEAGLLDIQDPVSDYLGTGWTSVPPDKEALITIRHQLTMTAGLDDSGLNDNCTLPACLTYKADAGTRWAYYNAPYRLIHDVLEAASGQTINQFTNNYLLSRTGMRGVWFDHIQYGRARDMARFGLLTLAGGVWNGDTLLHDQQYQYDMSHPSQDLNKSYGYLWWLNGQDSYMLPGFQLVLPGPAIPNAPTDMYAALGANDQKIHIVPSKGWVIVRQGNAGYTGPGGGAVPIILDNIMWDYINKLVCNTTGTSGFASEQELAIYPNPTSGTFTIESPHPLESVTFYAPDGRQIAVFPGEQRNILQIITPALTTGTYYLQAVSDGRIYMKNVVLMYNKE